MFRILLVMVIGGAALVFAGVQEMRLAGSAKAEPQAISCAKLIESGPGDNAHVKMGDFLLSTGAICIQEGKNGGKWQNVWVPAVPLNGAYHQKLVESIGADGKLAGPMPIPDDIRVIVKSSKIGGEQQLETLADQDTLQGMVVNKIASLGSKEKKILAESYPGVNFDKCLIIEHGRTPASSGKSYGMMGGGALLSVLGVLGFFRSKTSA